MLALEDRGVTRGAAHLRARVAMSGDTWVRQKTYFTYFSEAVGHGL